MQLRHLAIVLCLTACDETISAGKPVGVAVDTEAELQRYLRRAYLDLTGAPPSEAQLTAGTARLRDAGNTSTSREALAGELIADQAFSRLWIEELENAIFGGNSLEQQYAFVCAIVRPSDPVCESCTLADACACTCPTLQTFHAERAGLRTAAADLHGGAATSAIERRYAKAAGYYILGGTPEGRAGALFDDFLARTAEPDEIENGRAMILGAIFPNAPAGLMFHRHGASYADLLDIVFESEVYREALVRRAFERYLARTPSSAELVHFVATLDANEPDARGLVRAIASSREYFDQ